MKIAFITTFYRDEDKKEIERLKKEVKDLRLQNYQFYVSDCRQDNRGYASGINKGIQKALKDGVDIFVVCNFDISLKGLSGKDLTTPAKYFDIWGYSHRQLGKTYFGGEIDKWRMSGGLISLKPKKRFTNVDFISGSFICIKRTVIEKIGLWEESYFLYYEEVDYCVRAARSGFRIGIDAEKRYEHFEISNTVNKKKNHYLARSRLLFLMRFGSWKQKIYELLRSPKTVFEEREAIVAYILSSSFLINFFSLNVSSFFIKLTNFVNFLFLVRYLTAPEYGIYTLVWAQVTLLSPLADLGTTSYGVIYLPTEKEKVFQSLFSLRAFVSVLIFFVTMLLTVLLFRGNIKLNAYILITATVIFTNMFSGSYFILMAIKNKLYVSSRNSFLFNAFLVIAIAISLVLWKRLLYVFIIIFIFYNVYSLLNVYFIKHEVKRLQFNIDFKSWFAILKHSYIFVLISFFAGLYFRLDIFLLKLLKSDTEVGVYSAGYKFFEALLFIATSYNVTAGPILSRIAHNRGLLKRRIIKDIFFLTAIGFVVAAGIAFLAPFFLTHIFRKSYTPSIPVLQIVIFALPFLLLNSLWMNIIYVLKKAYLVIFVFAFQTLFNFALNYFFIPRYSYFASSYITVISEVVNCVILLILVRCVWKIPKQAHDTIVNKNEL